MFESRSRRQVATFAGVMLLALLAVFGLIWREARVDRRQFPEDCDVEALERRSPRLDEVALTDEALVALGSEAMADILDACPSLDPGTRWMMEAMADAWNPRITDGRSVPFGSPPTSARTLALREHTCGEGWAQARYAADLPGNQRMPFVFEICELERFGLLDAADVAHVESPWLGVWSWYVVLIDSGVSEAAARSYFLAIALASDIDERGAGELRIRSVGHWTREGIGTPWTNPLPDDELPEPQTLRVDSDGCWPHYLSIDADAPIERLRAVLEVDPESPARDCRWPWMTLSITEREQLLRPIRTELDFASPTAADAELELELEADGRWRAATGESFDSSAPLAELLDRRRPSSLHLRVDPSTAARLVVELGRVASSWRAAQRVDMKIRLSYR